MHKIISNRIQRMKSEVLDSLTEWYFQFSTETKGRLRLGKRGVGKWSGVG